MSTPKTVFWELTNRCNLACEQCYNKAFLNNPASTLSREEGTRHCRMFIEAGIEAVVFLGGEPLADKNIFEYLRIFRDAGVRCQISTNGTLLDGRRAQLLVEAGVFLVAVSLDGGNPTANDRVRGAGTFERIVLGLRTRAAYRRNGIPRIAIAYTLAEEHLGR